MHFSTQSIDWEKWKPGVRELKDVQQLHLYNDELADACALDRTSARLQLYHRYPSLVARRLENIDAARRDSHHESTEQVLPLRLEHASLFQVHEIQGMLRPCVADNSVLQDSQAVLSRRLLAVLQHTAIQDNAPLDLTNPSSWTALDSTYRKAVSQGLALKVQPPSDDAYSDTARRRLNPVSTKEAMERLRRLCMPLPEEPLVSAEEFADLLVEARLEDVAIVDLRGNDSDRVMDILVVASARSPQHALAGARAVQHRVKEARRAVGVVRDVGLYRDGDEWYSVQSGRISVHCMDRRVRGELQLEEIWSEDAEVRWWRREERPLTLDNITAGDAWIDAAGGGLHRQR